MYIHCRLIGHEFPLGIIYSLGPDASWIDQGLRAFCSWIERGAGDRQDPVPPARSYAVSAALPTSNLAELSAEQSG